MSHPVTRTLPRFDVVIVGAGLAGLFLARRLQRAGLSVAAIDKNPVAGGYGGVVAHDGRTYPLVNYKALGIGTLDTLVDGAFGEPPVRVPYCDHVFLPD